MPPHTPDFRQLAVFHIFFARAPRFLLPTPDTLYAAAFCAALLRAALIFADLPYAAARAASATATSLCAHIAAAS